MSNLQRKYNSFVYKHRNKGIPQLMLWVCILNAVFYVLTYFLKSNISSYLYFDSALILKGEVWRFFTYIFTFSCQYQFLGNSLLGAVFSIMFYYWVGTLLEKTWGTCRFNLYYFSGILLAGVYALLIDLIFNINASAFMSAHYLNLSLFLAAASLLPDAQIQLWGIIPLKMKWMAWLDMGFTLYFVGKNLWYYSKVWSYWPPMDVVGNILALLLPLVFFANYFIFFGKSVSHLLPNWMRRKGSRPARKKIIRTQAMPEPDYGRNADTASRRAAYHHKCAVCGRTDVDHPNLEFRYCSKCAGYVCYCLDHIGNHAHVE